jgi:hypothetical protein
MKIGEAVLERDHLNSRLDALEARLTADLSKGRPLTHIINEVEEAANRVLALQDAIDWTLQHLSVSGKTLGAYLNKSDHLQRLADLLENADSPDLRDQVDEFQEARKVTEVLVQTIYWAYDLQIPEMTVSEEPEEED